MRPQDSNPTPENTPKDNLNLSPEEKQEHAFVRFIKKTGYTIWIAVMVIGGTLAFIVSLFLV